MTYCILNPDQRRILNIMSKPILSHKEHLLDIHNLESFSTKNIYFNFEQFLANAMQRENNIIDKNIIKLIEDYDIYE